MVLLNLFILESAQNLLAAPCRRGAAGTIREYSAQVGRCQVLTSHRGLGTPPLHFSATFLQFPSRRNRTIFLMSFCTAETPGNICSTRNLQLARLDTGVLESEYSLQKNHRTQKLCEYVCYICECVLTCFKLIMPKNLLFIFSFV